MKLIQRMGWSGVVVASLVLSAGALTACGSSSSSTSSGESAGGGATDTQTTAAKSAESEKLHLAFLPGVTANPYFQAEIRGAKELAAKENAELTVIDSQLDEQKQVQQMEDLAATKQYDGILVVPLNGAALVPAVTSAIQNGVAVGAADVPIGPDPTETETQVDGVAVYSGRPFSSHGEDMAKLTVEACKGIDPCNVAFMFGVKASTYDQALFESYKQGIESSPNIHIVAEAEGGFTREGGLTAMQDMLQANDEIDVLVAVDQEALGAETAIKAAGKAGQIKIIGYGGTEQAVAAVAAGRWFGDDVQVPVTEAELGLKGVIDAVRLGKTTGHVDPVAADKVPGNGMLTKENAAGFEAQYAG